MAQQQPAPRILELEEAGTTNSGIVPVVDETNTPLVGNSILMAMSSGPTTPTDPPRVGPEQKAPGKTKSTIVGLLLIGGAVTAILLALSGGDKATPPAPVAAPATVQPTIITAGTPRVSSPN